MTEYTIRYTLVRAAEAEPRVSANRAAAMAGADPDLLEICRREGLIYPERGPDGGPRYSPADVQRLTAIARLREEAQMDLETIEVVMHLRQQLVEVHCQMDALRRAFLQREQELLETISRLEQSLSSEASWWSER